MRISNLVSILFSGMALCSFSFIAEASGKQSVTPGQALEKLLEGNQRYMASSFNTCKDTTLALREQLAKGQAPYAVILTCSDSRLPPELIFDKTPGEIFVVRVAGNVPDPLVLGSIEYAIEHLGSSLIMVLGHERCGAVTATVDSNGHAEGNIGDIVKRIAPAAARAKKEAAGRPKAEIVEAAIDINIDMVSQNLMRQSKVIKEFVEQNKLRIIPAKFDLDSGKVSLR